MTHGKKQWFGFIYSGHLDLGAEKFLGGDIKYKEFRLSAISQMKAPDMSLNS